MSYRKDQYDEYIHSLDWENQKIKIRDIYKKHNWPIACIRCGTKADLDLHHNYYSQYLEAVFLSDVDFLCSTCHKKWHSSRVGHIYLNQNYLIRQNFDFYIEDKDFIGRRNILDFLSEKIKKDETILTFVFSKSEFIRYEAYENAGLMAILFNTIEKEEKPSTYDYFIERKKLLKSKNNIIETL